MSQSSKPSAALTSQTQKAVVTTEVSFGEKTERIKALTQLIKSITPFIWAIVLAIVLIPLGGKYLIGQSLPFIQSQKSPVVIERTVQATDWKAVDQAVATALQTARSEAQTFAAGEIVNWSTELEPRIEGFLDWYFDFFHQKTMEFSTPFVWGYASLWHRINPNTPTGQTAVVDRLSAQFQQEFAKRVLVPQNAQLRLERITTETVDRYLNNINQKIGAIQTKYKIPQGTWNRYLADISTSLGQEGSISHLSMKTVAGGGTYLALKPLLTTSIGKLGSKASAKFVGTATSKAAAKTGGAIAAELGAAVLDPVVGVGILVWDVVDYRQSIKRDRPVLKQNLTDYLQDVQQMLLNHPESGVMAAITQLEQNILKSLQK
jgi:hypothetical protein